MGQSVIRNSRKIHSQSGGDPSLPTRVTNLENNEYKVTYYEIITGASGSLTLPTGATINAGEFGLSGNCILSKIDGSNKPTFESPKTAGGVVVTASLNETTGAWVASAVYTDVSVALIYSIKIKAINYSNLTYANIIEPVELTDFPISQVITNGVIDKSPSEDAVFDGLTLKVDKNTSITGATKTKITYDSKGLVTSGADATTADIADSLNKRYVTDANLTVIGNTSGTNTGDQTLSGLGGVPTTRSLTINGTTYDLSADRTWTISTASNVAIKDEGSTLTSAVTSIDFIGSAVTTTAVGNDVTVNITGGGVASATNNLFNYYNFI